MFKTEEYQEQCDTPEGLISHEALLDLWVSLHNTNPMGEIHEYDMVFVEEVPNIELYR